jgi:hypothetical protein
MGYAQTSPTSFFEIGSPLQQYFDVEAIAADKDMNFTMAIPVWIRPIIKHAYLDAYFPYVYNNRAAMNETDGAQVIKISIDGGAFTNTAIDIHTLSFTCWANDGIAGTVRLIGTYDIGALVRGAATLGFRWALAKASADSLSFSNIFFILRVTAE